jgi:hypothetical protein
MNVMENDMGKRLRPSWVWVIEFERAEKGENG